jgi:hypothetical protein
VTAQSGQRQARNQGNAPERPPREKLSEDQLAYVDGVARLQAAAAQDEILNGIDSVRRLREGDDGGTPS